MQIKYARVGSTSAEYVGRRASYYAASALGNPYKADPDNPGATLPKYKAWLWQTMQDINSPQSQELRRLVFVAKRDGEITLSCWCHNHDTCHSSVIKAAMLWMMNKESKHATDPQN